MARVLSFLIRYFSNYYTLYRSDLAALAAPLYPRLQRYLQFEQISDRIVTNLQKLKKGSAFIQDLDIY